MLLYACWNTHKWTVDSITRGRIILFAEEFSVRRTCNDMPTTQIVHWPESGLHGGGRILHRHIAMRKLPNALATIEYVSRKNGPPATARNSIVCGSTNTSKHPKI